MSFTSIFYLNFFFKEIYSLPLDAVKRWSPNATDSEIDAAMAEHLKRAPGRAGGGGYKK